MADDERNSIRGHKNGTENNKNSEPTEMDPCIDEKPRSRKFLDNAELVLRDKTGLSKEGLRYVCVLVIVILLLFIIIIALGIAWPTIPHHQQFPICKESACLRASAQIQESLDSSASPCTDIWKWACGGWLKKHNLPDDRGIWNQKEILAKQEATRIRDLITTLPLPVNMGSVERKLLYFYESCMDVNTIEIEKDMSIMSIIMELGGWYIMKNFNRNDFDSKQVLESLHVKYGVSPFFKISVVPNPNSPGNSSISISPAGLGLPDRKYYYTQNNFFRDVYVQLIKDVVISLTETATTTEEAKRFGENMFGYEKRIAEITPETSVLENPVVTYNIMKISELKLAAGNLNLHDILSTMFPEVNIDEETEIILTSPDYLAKVSQIVSTTDSEALNGYMIWTLVREYLPYLSSGFTSAWNAYIAHLLGSKVPLERWEFCANLIQKFMGVAIDVFLERKNPLTDTTKSVVTDVFNSVKKIVQKRLEKFRIMPNLYKHLTKKMKLLSLQIGLPEQINEDEYLKNYYKKMNVIKRSFFDNYKHGIVFLKKLQERRLTSRFPEDYIILASHNQPINVNYLPSANTVIISRSLLTVPYYEDEYPKAVIFGRLGFEIANAIVSSILPYNSAWTSDLKLLTQFHITINESIRDVQYPKRCLSNFIVTKNLYSEDAANLSSLNTLIHLSALSTAEEALLDLNIKSNHIHQPSLETLEESSLFYLAYAQTMCSNTSQQYELYDSLIKFNLPQKTLLEVAWHQVIGFPESFSCSYDDEDLRCSDIF